MPEIIRINGIKIAMMQRGKDHNPPHIHAKYAEFEALIDISNGNIIEGHLPTSQLSIVKRFVRENQRLLWDQWGR